MSGLAAGAAALVGASFGWWGALAVTAMVSLFALTRGSPRPVASCALVIAAGLLGAWSSSVLHANPAFDELAAFETVLVVSNPIRDNELQRFVVVPELPQPDPDAAATRICVTGEILPEVHIGDSLLLSGTARPSRDAPAGPRAAYGVRSCMASLYSGPMSVVASRASPARWLADIRFQVSHVLRSAAPGDAGVLLSGLVTGDDAGFSPGRDAAFVRTGTTHLTAVSGANLALVAGFLATIGAATLGRHRLSWQALTIACVWGYALITGAQAPAVRAAIVATAAIVAFRVGRQPDFPTLIVLAAGGMAIIDPGHVDALGFRLSVASSLALAIVLPAMMERDHMSGFSAVLAASATAQIATLPFLLTSFGTLSVVSLPANVLVAPLAIVAMPLAACAGLLGLVSPQIGGIVAAPATLTANAMLAIVDALSSPRAIVQAGTPPIEVAVALAATSVLLLLVLSRDPGSLCGRLHGRERDANPGAAVRLPHPNHAPHRQTQREFGTNVGQESEQNADPISDAVADPQLGRSSVPPLS